MKKEEYIERNKLEAYRLLTEEEAGLPLAIDIYKDNAVIHIFGEIPQAQMLEIEKSLRRDLNIKNFFYKNRTKTNFPLPKNNPDAPKEIIIEENGLKFSINLSDYIDTGLFLDHRETREWIRAQSKGKTVLNTFAYTGSFSVYAAAGPNAKGGVTKGGAGAGGAEKTYSIDLSRTYCEWIKKNLALNNLPPEKNWVYKMDTFEFFKYARRKKLRFDIIIIDPPTFSRNKGRSFSVQKDHTKLINEALELLKPKGFILFSNNCREFHLDRAALSPCKIQEKTDTVSPDFQNSFSHWCYVISQAADNVLQSLRTTPLD